MTVVSYFVASCSNPGHLEKGFNMLHLLSITKPENICPYCEVLKTPRSFHCGICSRCVYRFDHHCVWLNNCVGIRNHNSFFIFLFSLSATMVFSIVQMGIAVLALIIYGTEEQRFFMMLCDDPFDAKFCDTYILISSIAIVLFFIFFSFLAVCKLFAHNFRVYSKHSNSLASPNQILTTS